MNGTFLSNRIRHRDEFGLLLNRMNLLDEGVEVGVFLGDFSRQLLSTWQGRKLHLVDPWRELDDYNDTTWASDSENEQRYRITLEKLNPFPDRYQIHRKLSLDAAREFSPKSLDFVYIDANHAYEHVRADIKAWFPKVRKGGILAGHDFLDYDGEEASFGVRSAVEKFARESGLPFSLTEEDFASWYFIL